MKTVYINDRYNPNKVWIIKHYTDGHYYINQSIKGMIIYKSFQRTTKKLLIDIMSYKNKKSFIFLNFSFF